MTGRSAAEMDDSMDSDIHARVGRLEQASAGSRITALEVWKQQVAVDDATRKGDWSNMREKIDGVSSSVKEVQATLTWLNRLILGGIATGFVLFMMRGGMNIPPL